MSVVVKIKFDDGTTRRRRVDAKHVSLAYLYDLAKENLACTEEAPSFVYEDDEGDLVSIVSDSCVAEALRVLGPSQSLKLQVVPSSFTVPTSDHNERIGSADLKGNKQPTGSESENAHAGPKSAPQAGDKNTQAKTAQKKSVPTKPDENTFSFHNILPNFFNFGRGSRGHGVHQLQQVLIQLGYMHPSAISWCSGIYGPRTTEAVIRVAHTMGSTNPVELSGIYTEGIRQFLIQKLSDRKKGRKFSPHENSSRQERPNGCCLQRLITFSFLLALLPTQLLYFAFYFVLISRVFSMLFRVFTWTTSGEARCKRKICGSHIFPIIAAIFLRSRCSCCCCAMVVWIVVISGVHIFKKLIAGCRRCRRKRIERRNQKDRQQIELAFKSMKPLRLIFPARSDAELFYQLKQCGGSANNAAWVLAQQ